MEANGILNHKRRREFETTTCSGTELLPFIVFFSEVRLKEHAVKHCLSSLELDAWKMHCSDPQELQNMYEELRDIDCAYLTGDDIFETSCTERNNKATCGSDAIEKLCNQYVSGIESVLRKTLRTPRYALYYSRFMSGVGATSLLSDEGIIIMATLLSDGHTYNVTTAYMLSRPPGWTWSDLILKQVQRIEYEAARGDVNWCRGQNWGFMEIESDAFEEHNDCKEKRQNKRRKRLDPPVRSGKNWRSWYQQFEEECHG